MRPLKNSVVAGLPKIVADGAEHQGELPATREVVDTLPGFVDDHQRVHPHVAFGVPVGLLPAPDQRRQLGKQPVNHPEFEGRTEADRRPGRGEQQLLHLAPDALGRQVIEGDRAAQVARRLVDGEVEARGELHGTQDAEAVVGEGPQIDRAQQTPREIGAAVERIDHLVGQRIPGDRVDREVPPPGGLLDRHVRVATHLETPVAEADLRLAARQRHVDRRPPCRP